MSGPRKWRYAIVSMVIAVYLTVISPIYACEGGEGIVRNMFHNVFKVHVDMSYDDALGLYGDSEYECAYSDTRMYEVFKQGEVDGVDYTQIIKARPSIDRRSAVEYEVLRFSDGKLNSYMCTIIGTREDYHEIVRMISSEARLGSEQHYQPECSLATIVDPPPERESDSSYWLNEDSSELLSVLYIKYEMRNDKFLIMLRINSID